MNLEAAYAQLKSLYNRGGRQQILLFLSDLKKTGQFYRGTSQRTIDTLLRPRGTFEQAFAAHDSTKSVIVELARRIGERRLPQIEQQVQLHALLRDVCHLDQAEQLSIEGLLGQYTTFRWAKETIISGLLTIDHLSGTNICYFWHKTKQPIEAKSEEFDHQGLLLRIQDRLYFLAAESKVIRPMIAIFTNNLDMEPIIGVQIALRYPSLKPMAMKFCMFHSTYQQEISEATIRKYLENPEDTRNVLYL